MAPGWSPLMMMLPSRGVGVVLGGAGEALSPGSSFSSLGSRSSDVRGSTVSVSAGTGATSGASAVVGVGAGTGGVWAGVGWLVPHALSSRAGSTKMGTKQARMEPSNGMGAVLQSRK